MAIEVPAVRVLPRRYGIAPDRIRFGSMVVVSGIATTAAVSTSPFQFRRRQRERGKLLNFQLTS
jgi:hypothetical protein